MGKAVEKFTKCENILQCPLCGSGINVKNSSMLCKKGHCYDIASAGYVNMVPAAKAQKGYDVDFFTSRRHMMEAGLYDTVVEALLNILPKSSDSTIVDAGCGDGYYAHKFFEHTNGQVFAFDLSKDAVKIGAKNSNDVCWIVADLARLPVKNESADYIFNIYSPANYSEFHRVMKKDGLLIKVVPGENHQIELRKALHSKDNSEYSNNQVVDHFKRNFELIDRVSVSSCIDIDGDMLRHLLNMSPLMFDIDEKQVQNIDIPAITIEAEILVGKI